RRVILLQDKFNEHCTFDHDLVFAAQQRCRVPLHRLLRQLLRIWSRCSSAKRVAQSARLMRAAKERVAPPEKKKPHTWREGENHTNSKTRATLENNQRKVAAKDMQ